MDTAENPPKSKPFPPINSSEITKNSSLSYWVSRSVRFLRDRARAPGRNRIASKRYRFDGMVVSNSVFCDSPNYVEAMMNGGEAAAAEWENGKSGDLNGEESGESSLNSDVGLNCEMSSSGDSSSSPTCVGWPLQKKEPPLLVKQGSCLSETEMMKERFAKLLLGEDMSGCGNGVCTALAISNAITNLCATLFGQIWRLEPLQSEKKLMWRREMDWLLCVSDHVVELIPSWQTFPDGSKLEVMTSRPRADLYVNLPALRKLDNMLLEILESFENSEFWYVKQGILAPEADGMSSLRRPLSRQEDKWWLPVPRVPHGGLSDDARKTLQQRRDSTNQILKAAMAINSAALAEMDIPDSYLEALPKNGRASLGDLIHRHINSDQFSPEYLLDCLGLTSEHQALEIANKVEATILLWRRKLHSKPLDRTQRSNSRSSWEMVKDMVSDADKREVLAGRAESLLLCLKQRFPGLPQTTLDMSKIQCNKDVGKSILESYSRVLESLAFNIVARIDDLLYVDDLSKQSDQLISISKVSVITHSPYRTSFAPPSLLISPVNGDTRAPCVDNNKLPVGGFGVKRILTDYLSFDGKTEDLSSNMRRSDSFSSTTREVSTSPSFGSSSRGSTEAVSQQDHDFVVFDH